MMWKY